MKRVARGQGDRKSQARRLALRSVLDTMKRSVAFDHTLDDDPVFAMPHNARVHLDARRGQAAAPFVRCAISLIVFMTAARDVAAQGQSQASSPRDALTVKAEWPQANTARGGYLPVHLELTSPRGPRELRVAVLNRGFPVGSEVSQLVTLEPNKPMRFTLSVPVTSQQMYGDLRVYERGSELDSVRMGGIGGGMGWGQEAPNILLVGRAAPDWRIFDQSVTNFLVGSSAYSPLHSVIAPDKLPTRWIDFTMLDLVLVPIAELEQIPPLSRDALAAWTFAGGNLVVTGVITERDEAALEQFLDLKQRAVPQPSWRKPRQEDRGVAPPGTAANPGASNSATWHSDAASRLERQGPEAYRTYCTNIFTQYGATVRTSNDMNNLAWACVIGPDAVPDIDAVVRLAERSVASGRSYANLNTLGVALYRTGRYQEAVNKLNEAIAAHGQGGGPQDWFFLAMGHKKLENEADAKKWLDKATLAADTTSASSAEVRVFRREADALFNPTNQAEPSKDGKPATPTNDPNTSKGNDPAPKPPVEPTFSIRLFGMGQVVRMTTLDPFPGLEEDWTWLWRTLGSSRLRWTERHGLNARAGNTDFWNFLIEGAGRAPVIAFQVFITIFTLVIGPLNYFVLRRRKQLYFLIVTVPSVALLTTSLLFGYSVASEGFGVRTRVRSVTLLDQVHGESVSWSRVSYYAGLAPTGGLRFSTDTAVYPIDPDGATPGYRTVDWTEGQHLTGGWLLSRTPTQLFLVSHRQTGEQLAVASDDSGHVRVTNNLGAGVRLLVLAGDDGALYTAENIERGARVPLAPADAKDAAQAVRERIQAQRLDTPSELQERGAWEPLFFMRAGFGLANSAAVDSSASLLEETLRQLANPAAKGSPPTGPRTYIAIVEQPPLVELGVRETVDSGSLYVIWGAY
jgi:hypothetical protein